MNTRTHTAQFLGLQFKLNTHNAHICTGTHTTARTHACTHTCTHKDMLACTYIQPPSPANGVVAHDDFDLRVAASKQ